VIASLAARVPDAIAATAVVVLVRTAAGSYPAAGLAAGAFGLGTAASAPLAGRALDRLGQRRVLPVLAVTFGGFLAALAAAAGHLPAVGLAVLAAAAGLTRPPVEAALRALWPRLVPASWLGAAYTLDSTVQELIWIAGPLLLAGLLVVGGPRAPLLACALLSAAGTVGYVLSPRLASARRRARGAGSRRRGGVHLGVYRHHRGHRRRERPRRCHHRGHRRPRRVPGRGRGVPHRRRGGSAAGPHAPRPRASHGRHPRACPRPGGTPRCCLTADGTRGPGRLRSHSGRRAHFPAEALAGTYRARFIIATSLRNVLIAPGRPSSRQIFRWLTLNQTNPPR
jgi:Major Facilitator Superfamily